MKTLYDREKLYFRLNNLNSPQEDEKLRKKELTKEIVKILMLLKERVHYGA